MHLHLHSHMMGVEVGRNADWEDVTTLINIQYNYIDLKIKELVDWIYWDPCRPFHLRLCLVRWGFVVDGVMRGLGHVSL